MGTPNPETGFVYGNIITNNSCREAGDTPIESGFHSDGTIITGNSVEAPVHSGILLRDARNILVDGNTVQVLAGAVSDGISVCQQVEGHDWASHSSICNNIVTGDIPRAGIYADQSYVTISNNELSDDDATTLGGYGIVLVNDGYRVSGNQLENFNEGISFVYGSLSHTDVRVSGNFIDNVNVGVNLYGKTIAESEFTDNSIGTANQKGFCLNGSNGSNSTRISGNIIQNSPVDYSGSTSTYIFE